MSLTSQERNNAIDQYKVLVDLIDRKKLDYSKSALEAELSSYKFISWCKCNRFLEFLLIVFIAILTPFTGFVSLIFYLIWASLYWMHQANYAKYVAVIESLNGNNLNQSNFNGEKSLSNDAYQLYLVNKWAIHKNEVLNKFVVNEKLFNTIEEAIQHASMLEIERENKSPMIPPIEIQTNIDGTWTCPKSGHQNPLPIGKCNYCGFDANSA